MKKKLQQRNKLKSTLKSQQFHLSCACALKNLYNWSIQLNLRLWISGIKKWRKPRSNKTLKSQKYTKLNNLCLTSNAKSSGLIKCLRFSKTQLQKRQNTNYSMNFFRLHTCSCGTASTLPLLTNKTSSSPLTTPSV